MYRVYNLYVAGTLVSLLTVEAQSYGPSALINIKVVEHVPAMSGVPSVMPPPPPGSVNVIHSQPAVMSTPALIPRIPLRPSLVMSAPLQQVPVIPSVKTSVPAPVVPSGMLTNETFWLRCSVW